MFKNHVEGHKGETSERRHMTTLHNFTSSGKSVLLSLLVTSRSGSCLAHKAWTCVVSCEHTGCKGHASTRSFGVISGIIEGTSGGITGGAAAGPDRGEVPVGDFLPRPSLSKMLEHSLWSMVFLVLLWQCRWLAGLVRGRGLCHLYCYGFDTWNIIWKMVWVLWLYNRDHLWFYHLYQYDLFICQLWH